MPQFQLHITHSCGKVNIYGPGFWPLMYLPLRRTLVRSKHYSSMQLPAHQIISASYKGHRSVIFAACITFQQKD
jgi:hypothetical protein